METHPNNNEVARLETVNQELCQKIVDLEAEIERKNKALEGFIAENEALKAELGGKTENSNGGKETPPVEVQKHGGGEGKRQDLVGRLTRALEEAARK